MFCSFLAKTASVLQTRPPWKIMKDLKAPIKNCDFHPKIKPGALISLF